MSTASQFLWGLVGGTLVSFPHVGFYLWDLPARPNSQDRRRLSLLFVGWLFFVILAALVTVACRPHSELLAIYEGASAPALFFTLGQHYRHFMERRHSP